MLHDLEEKIQSFVGADDSIALVELVVTMGGFILTICGLYLSYTYAWWWMYGLMVLIGGLFSVKLFTIQHDCGHESFFSSPHHNLWAGRLCSLFMTMPFSAWKKEHHIHHAQVGDIEKVGAGDIALLTVEQYRLRGIGGKCFYRLQRNPLFHIVFAPFIYFFLISKVYNIWRSAYIKSTMLTNLATLLFFGTFLWLWGLWTTVAVFMPPLYIAGVMGITLFYLQHNFPKVQWFTSGDWSRMRAAKEGSSLIILPKPLEWFTHSIGYHYIHHIHPGIPGYKLRKCHDAVKEMHAHRHLTWFDVWHAFRLRLWSHDKNSLVTFAEAACLKR